MRAAGEAKDALASGAKPRLEERVREQGRRPTRSRFARQADVIRRRSVRRRAIKGGRYDMASIGLPVQGGLA
jgi:hypothetical protein